MELTSSKAGTNLGDLFMQAVKGVLIDTPRNYSISVTLDYDSDKTITFHMTREDFNKLQSTEDKEHLYLVEVEGPKEDYMAYAQFALKPKASN